MHRYAATIVILILALTPLCAGPPDLLDAPGVRNFHQVDPHLYRGAQPTSQGFTSLAKVGIRTVIDLRGGRELREDEQKIVEAAGMHYVHVPMAGLSAPSDQQITTVLGILNDTSAWPVFVHCRRGADRTGTVIACYRIAHDHWDNEKALREAQFHGMSSLEYAMKQYILHFEAPGKPAQPELKQAVATQ